MITDNAYNIRYSKKNSVIKTCVDSLGNKTYYGKNKTTQKAPSQSAEILYGGILSKKETHLSFSVWNKTLSIMASSVSLCVLRAELFFYTFLRLIKTFLDYFFVF